MKLILYSILFLAPSTGFGEDRITLFTGEIFLGTIKGEENSRFIIDRSGFERKIPNWFVTRIEKNQTVLIPAGAPTVLSPTQTVDILGRRIALTSKPPAQTSHVERYSPRGHFWSPSYRYLRGYLVNQTQMGYRRLSVSITYYSQSQKTPLYRHETEIFDVYPMTMKPFIVDCRFVPWEKVDRIDFMTVAGLKQRLP